MRTAEPVGQLYVTVFTKLAHRPYRWLADALKSMFVRSRER